MADKPDADIEARNRFLLMNAMRVGGVVMVVIGIAISVGEWNITPVVGWVLIGLGLVETLIVPQMLARMWSSNRRP